MPELECSEILLDLISIGFFPYNLLDHSCFQAQLRKTTANDGANYTNGDHLLPAVFYPKWP